MPPELDQLVPPECLLALGEKSPNSSQLSDRGLRFNHGDQSPALASSTIVVGREIVITKGLFGMVAVLEKNIYTDQIYFLWF